MAILRNLIAYSQKINLNAAASNKTTIVDFATISSGTTAVNENVTTDLKPINTGRDLNNYYSQLTRALLLLSSFTILIFTFFILRQLFFRKSKPVLHIKATPHPPEYSGSLVAVFHDPLFTIDTGRIILEANKAMATLTGYSCVELNDSDFFKCCNDKHKAQQQIETVFASGVVVKIPLTLRQKDGKCIDIIFNGSAYRDETGNIAGAVLAAENGQEMDSAFEVLRIKKELSKLVDEKEKYTAELIRTKEELSFQTFEKEKREVANADLETTSNSLKIASQYSLSLIESSRDPLFTINLNGKITDLNEAAVKATGVSRDKLTGSYFPDYFTESEKAREAYKRIFDEGFIVDFPLTITDGQFMDVLCNGSTYKDDKGNVTGVVIVARDITDQKRIATELNEAIVFAELAVGIAEEAKIKAETATMIAETAVKAKQQFLSNMSHEIRTPMNAIIGFTKVLLKTETSVKQKEYLQAIKMSGDALIVLINDILDLAKVDAGKMIFEQTAFKMGLSISAMLHLFEQKIREKNLELVKEYDPAIPEVLVGDPMRLHQIIINLVSNAVKFTNKGSITVSVKLVKEDETKVAVSFSVKDTGIGIAPNKLEKIFDNFQQASSETSRLYGGTGLGLAIVRQLVEAQDGTISVESKVNEGSEFSFILDFIKTKSDVKTDEMLMELDAEIENVNVLVVEDIALNQLLMRTLLDDFGFRCDIAANGKIAIEKLKAGSYDIILMDLQMPEMNGFEATEFIRKEMKSEIPIIALTADVTTVDLAKCKAVGMNDYIAKPVDEKLLYSKIVNEYKKAAHLIVNKNPAEITEVKTMKYTDLQYLITRTKSNPVLMMEMISLYLEQTPPLISVMKKSWKEKDWNQLYASVHKMIPSFAVMGISSDYENMARKVQDFAKNQQQSDGINDMVMQIDTVCSQACVELAAEYTLIKNAS